MKGSLDPEGWVSNRVWFDPKFYGLKSPQSWLPAWGGLTPGAVGSADGRFKQQAGTWVHRWGWPDVVRPPAPITMATTKQRGIFHFQRETSVAQHQGLGLGLLGALRVMALQDAGLYSSLSWRIWPPRSLPSCLTILLACFKQGWYFLFHHKSNTRSL